MFKLQFIIPFKGFVSSNQNQVLILIGLLNYLISAQVMVSFKSTQRNGVGKAEKVVNVVQDVKVNFRIFSTFLISNF